MPIECVQSAGCDEPRSRVADYFPLAVGDPVFPQTRAEETDLGAAIVASGALHESLRTIGDWVRPAWQGQGSVVRQEGRVRVFSGLLRGWSWQPMGLDYTLVSSLQPPPAQPRVLRQEGQVRVSSRLLRNSFGQPAALEYTMVCLLDPQAAQVAVSARADALLGSGAFCALVGSGDSSLGVLFTRRGLVLEASNSSDILQCLAEHSIVLPNAQEVASYLTDHPQLAQLLPNIGAEVRQALGPQVELSLELYNDPEIDDRYLTLYVRKGKYEPDILDRLQSVSERFNHRLEEVSGYFLLATDFSRPRGSHAV